MGKRGNICVALLAAAVALILLPGCADNRSSAEKLMDYIAKNGGSGSIESSVGADLPVKDAGASCSLKLSNAELEIDYVAPQDGLVSGVQLDDSLTFKVNLETGLGEWSREASMWVLGSEAKGFSQGSFEASSFTRSANPDIQYNIVTIDGKVIKGSSTAALSETLRKETGEALDCFSTYLEKSGTGLTLADFGFSSY